MIWTIVVPQTSLEVDVYADDVMLCLFDVLTIVAPTADETVAMCLNLLNLLTIRDSVQAKLSSLLGPAEETNAYLGGAPAEIWNLLQRPTTCTVFTTFRCRL